MSIFDRLRQAAAGSSGQPNAPGTHRQERFTFTALPESLAAMQALPEASLSSPFQTAALTVCALCVYGADAQTGRELLNWLRGPRPLNGQDISFLNDRFRGGKSYLPFSYFAGAAPESGYTPHRPFTLIIESDATSMLEPGYCKLFLPCGGADRPRPVKLRQAGDGRWFLWEQALLTNIRPPRAADPWA